MNAENKFFLERSELKAFDDEHRKKLGNSISKYETQYLNGRKLFVDYDYAREKAGFMKFKALCDLEKLLSEFESKFSANGGKVIWAPTANDAVEEIQKILNSAGIKSVVKSKSMISEELNLDFILESEQIIPWETDLGEFIVQQSGEKPYHILTPAMHKSKEEVAKLFSEKFGLPPNSSPEVITKFVRSFLRDKFIKAGASITGANFLIAETGSVCLTENEGNGMMCYSFPKIHIVVCGIEKVLPKLTDLDLFWHLLAVNGTGQHLTAYNSILSGPKKNDEIDGPEEMYVILLDNKRTKVFSEIPQRRSMSCIRCGACLNVCPIYKNIGGHAYGITYTGPIGTVISPLMLGFKQFHYLSYACSMCRRCSDVCAVKMPLNELILANRYKAAKEKIPDLKWRIGMRVSQYVLTRRKMMDKSPALKNFFMKNFVANMWGKRRDLPKFADKSFKKMWEEERGL